MKITLSEAVRRTGRSRVTIQRWIDQGWLPYDEIADSGLVRVVVDPADLPEAERMAAAAPKERRNVWWDHGEDRPIPSPGTMQHRKLGHWMRYHGSRILL